jgi:hypothetical protein
MAHAPTENWRKITRDDRVKDQSGHARPGRGRIGQPCWNWGGRVREWQVRRTGIFVASPFKNGQSSGRSDIVGNADGICRPDGAGIRFGLGFYNDAAPTALKMAGRKDLGKRPTATARPGRGRIGQPCRNWGRRSYDCDDATSHRPNCRITPIIVVI